MVTNVSTKFYVCSITTQKRWALKLTRHEVCFCQIWTTFQLGWGASRGRRRKGRCRRAAKEIMTMTDTRGRCSAPPPPPPLWTGFQCESSRCHCRGEEMWVLHVYKNNLTEDAALTSAGRRETANVTTDQFLFLCSKFSHCSITYIPSPLY